MNLEIVLLILVGILILLVVCSIPVLFQIWRVSKDMSVTLQSLNQSMPLILKNLEEITANINDSSALINTKIQNFANMSKASSLLLSDVLNNLQYWAPLAKKLPVFRVVRNIFAVARGLHVFTEVLFNKEKDEKLK